MQTRKAGLKAVTQSIWVQVFQICHRFETFPQGKNYKGYFPRFSFTDSVSCLERSFVLTCIEFWPEKPSPILCSKVLYSCHRDTTSLFKQNKWVCFFQPRLLPQIVAGVFPCVWPVGLFRAIFTFRASKCLSHVFPQVWAAENPIMTNIGIDRYLTQMKMLIDSSLLSHSWLTQSWEHLQASRKKGGWFCLCPWILYDSVLAVTFCYPKSSWKVLQ